MYTLKKTNNQTNESGIRMELSTGAFSVITAWNMQIHSHYKQNEELRSYYKWFLRNRGKQFQVWMPIPRSVHLRWDHPGRMLIPVASNFLAPRVNLFSQTHAYLDSDTFFFSLTLDTNPLNMTWSNQYMVEVWTFSFYSVGLKILILDSLFRNYSAFYTVPCFQGLKVIRQTK